MESSNYIAIAGILVAVALNVWNYRYTNQRVRQALLPYVSVAGEYGIRDGVHSIRFSIRNNHPEVSVLEVGIKPWIVKKMKVRWLPFRIKQRYGLQGGSFEVIVPKQHKVCYLHDIFNAYKLYFSEVIGNTDGRDTFLEDEVRDVLELVLTYTPGTSRMGEERLIKRYALVCRNLKCHDGTSDPHFAFYETG